MKIINLVCAIICAFAAGLDFFLFKDPLFGSIMVGFAVWNLFCYRHACASECKKSQNSNE